ncbi:MAG: D-alanyl-D-alanine carboxypeptidase [gamma proteobacterium symbiont of Lucinoma myriamae]|nr:D-alanyl-D-alanine carboxypeptidase [gamma proteobacterium symbiont of Lucinoma myriamae]
MTHYSAPVSEIIQTLFIYSNNFIANQLLIILGGEKKGAPADLEKGRQVVAEFLHNTVGINDFTLEEGSGLSRKNKITASEMMSLLIHFKPYHRLLRNYQNRFQAKTGTLRGISSFAGYMLSPSGETYPFVIMLNNPLRTSNRKEIANRIYNGIF